MGRMKRVEITWGLSWLIVAACGGTPVSDDSLTQTNGSFPSSGNNMGMSSSAGAAAGGGSKRATARIEPIALAPSSGAAGATGPTPGAAGAAAAGAAAAGTGAAGTGAAGESAGAAGVGGSAASTAGADGSAGAGGTGMGAGYAAGSGGEAGSASADPAAAGAGAAGSGTTDPAAGAAGAAGTTTEPGAAGAGGVASPATGGAGGAGVPEAPAEIFGTANFSASSTGVSLNVMVRGCQSGKQYPLHIHQGSSCESAMAQGPHWDMTRGEGIPNLVCGGRQGAATVMRANSDAATAWSVGDGSATDVIGHVLVIHDADDPTARIACGPIVTR